MATNPTVSRITVARLHNLGNYEHLRYEITLDLPEEADPGHVLEEVSGVLEDLAPVPKADWHLKQARENIAKHPAERDEYDIRNLPAHTKAVEEHDEKKRRHDAAAARLTALGGKREYRDAKDDWDDEDGR